MSVHNSDNGDVYVEDPVTLINKLDRSDPLHLHPNDSTTLTEELKEIYDKVDGSIMFGLHHQNHTQKQNRSSIADYYHKLNALWKQFDAMVELPNSILSREVLPDVTSAYATISSEESHRVAYGSVAGEVVNTIDFLVNNSGNDADSSEDIFAAQNEEVTTLDENVFSDSNLDQNPSTSA
ncbi:hypothetical protein Tco_0741243 [Tanacetum coccineum]